MLQFFIPNSKVQRDRHTLRETDARMAKYSRRGLVFNFIAFLICLIEGRFISDHKVLAIFLTTGLLLITLLRGWYVFRFDYNYPRAPTRWRNGYFASTLTGAVWWGLILFCITYFVGIEYETPLIWIYTVVFFSTTAHAFAPYHRFLGYYQFFGLVPASMAAFLLGGWNGYVYGTLMVCFYLILMHQCRLISDTYWEKLEANYALSRKAMSEEEERKENRENLQLTKEFISALKNEIENVNATTNIENIEDRNLNSLLENITIVESVVNKNLIFEKRVFNVRHELQYLVSKYVETANQRNIQIETSLSPTLPMRLKGDPLRFSKIVETLLKSMVACSETATVVIEAQFLREYERAGELVLHIRRLVQSSRINLFNSNGSSLIENTLELVTAKALADSLGGDIEITETAGGETQLRFETRLEISDLMGHLDFHRGRFNGSNILLVNSSAHIVDIKLQELSALGFNVTTETQHKRARQILLNAVRTDRPIENVLIYLEPNNPASTELLTSMIEEEELHPINKIIACTKQQLEDLQKRKDFNENHFYFVGKPVGLFELESTFDQILGVDSGDAENKTEPKIAFYTDKVSASSKTQRLLRKLSLGAITIESIEEVPEKISSGEVELLVVLCNQKGNYRSLIDAVRNAESSIGEACNFVPVIGVSGECDENDISAFESGFDDFIDVSIQGEKMLAARLRYWISLQH